MRGLDIEPISPERSKSERTSWRENNESQIYRHEHCIDIFDSWNMLKLLSFAFHLCSTVQHISSPAKCGSAENQWAPQLGARIESFKRGDGIDGNGMECFGCREALPGVNILQASNFCFHLFKNLGSAPSLETVDEKHAKSARAHGHCRIAARQQKTNNSKSQEYINNTSTTADCLDAGTRYFILDKKIDGSFLIQSQVHFFYTLSIHPKPLFIVQTHVRFCGFPWFHASLNPTPRQKV